MKIAIDINDVIRDNSAQFKNVYKKYIDPDFEIEDGYSLKSKLKDNKNMLELNKITEEEYNNNISNITNVKVIDSFNMLEVFPFESLTELNNFKYIDYPFELYGRAEECEKMLMPKLNEWLQNTLRDLDDEYVPEVMLVSPFESNLTIQSTLSFLSAHMVRCREYYFPIDSMTIWDKCDILITANPNLIKNKPEEKIAIKINMPYNVDVECKYSYDSIIDMINDENEIIINKLKNK